MLAAKDGEVVYELVDVIRSIKLRETRAAPDRTREAGDADVCKAAVRRVVNEIDAVIRCAVRSAAIRGQEPLIEVIEPKADCVDQSRSRRVVPLRPGKLSIGLVIGTPEGLADGLIIYDETTVAADEVLGVQGVLVVELKIELGQAVVHAVVCIQARGYVDRAGGAGGIAQERVRVQSKDGVSGRPGAIRIDARNF